MADEKTTDLTDIGPGEIRLVVMIDEGAAITPELEAAIDHVEKILSEQRQAPEVEGFTVFRVNVDRDEATIVHRGSKDPYAKLRKM